MVAKILRMQLREQSIPRLGRRSKAYYGARVERELLAAFDSCPERNFIALNDQNEVWGLEIHFLSIFLNPKKDGKLKVVNLLRRGWDSQEFCCHKSVKVWGRRR